MDDYRLSPGGVIHAFCYACKPPKDKFFVIGAIEPKPLLLVINSRLNCYVSERPKLHACHVAISGNNYTFLRHDSWVSCCDAFTDLSYDDLERELQYNPNASLGRLLDEDLLAVSQAIEISPTMQRKHKRILLQSLLP